MGPKLPLVLILLVTLSVLTTSCTAAKILFVLPISTKSIKNVYNPLIEGLAQRGHLITVISSVSSSTHPNVTEIVPFPHDKMFLHLANPFELRKLPLLKRLAAHSQDLIQTCEKCYANEEVKQLLENPEGKFDLVVVSAVGNHCVFGIVHAFKAPVIALLTMSPANFVTSNYGTFLPPSFVPLTFLNYTDEMSFLQRVENVVLQLVLGIAGELKFYPVQNAFKDKYHEGYPSLREIERNISLLLTNTHLSTNPKAPLLPDVVEVGGMHCRPAETIQNEDLRNWLDSSTKGFIYFSFGSVIQGHAMPENFRQLFFNVFSKLDVNVLWKWEGELSAFGQIPDNVRLQSWLPQQDVLGHPNMRVFITQGGILSVQEAVFHGVPILGFPFLVDQEQNMAFAVKNGFGKRLEILEIDEHSLTEAITEMLINTRYKEKAVEFSKIFRDQPETPLDRAIFWVEYVIRHKGATFLRSESRKLSFSQYHCYDVIGFLIAILAFTLLLVKKLVSLIIRLLCRLKSSFKIKRD